MDRITHAVAVDHRWRGGRRRYASDDGRGTSGRSRRSYGGTFFSIAAVSILNSACRQAMEADLTQSAVNRAENSVFGGSRSKSGPTCEDKAGQNAGKFEYKAGMHAWTPMDWIQEQGERGEGSTEGNLKRLGSDGGGLARFFIEVYDSSGARRYWNLSRAGAANPPPACSACSGGSTDGYPYSFGSKGNGNWTFWFDWITKARVNLSGSGNTIQQLFYVGEVNATGVTMSQKDCARDDGCLEWFLGRRRAGKYLLQRRCQLLGVWPGTPRYLHEWEPRDFPLASGRQRSWLRNKPALVKDREPMAAVNEMA